MKILENTIQNTRKCMYFLHYHTFHRGVLKNKNPTLLRAMAYAAPTPPPRPGEPSRAA